VSKAVSLCLVLCNGYCQNIVTSLINILGLLYRTYTWLQSVGRRWSGCSEFSFFIFPFSSHVDLHLIACFRHSLLCYTYISVPLTTSIFYFIFCTVFFLFLVFVTPKTKYFFRNWKCASCQEILPLLGESCGSFPSSGAHLLVCILIQLNPFHTLIVCFLKIRFDIILSSEPCCGLRVGLRTSRRKAWCVTEHYTQSLKIIIGSNLYVVTSRTLTVHLT